VLYNLISSLEKMFSIVMFDAIGVVLEVGDPAGELIRSLARDVIPERVAFGELIRGTLEETTVPVPDEPLPEFETNTVSGPVINTSSFLLPERGVVPVSSPKRRGRPPKSRDQNAPPRKRDGSGLKQGKLVGR